MEMKQTELLMLRDALLDAFTYQSFQEMLFFRLGEDMQRMAPPLGNFMNVIFGVIQTAKKENWIDDLVHSAHDENPGNVKLKQFTSQYLRYSGAAPTLEKIIQRTNSFLDVAAWRARLEKIERQVCSVEIDRVHAGTGFLISHDLVMTNYHVVEDLLGSSPVCSPEQVRIRFDFKKSEDGTILNEGVRYPLVGEWLVANSPYGRFERQGDFDTPPDPDELDYAVLRVAASSQEPGEPTTPGYEPVIGSRDKTRGWIDYPKGNASFTVGTPLFIVQHPDGQPLKMALATDSVIGLNDNGTRVRHKTNTEPGSSGSACFNSNWELVALHHAGDPNWHQPAWNQAVPVSAIRRHWEEQDKLSLILGGTPLAPASVTAHGTASGNFSADAEVDDLLQS